QMNAVQTVICGQRFAARNAKEIELIAASAAALKNWRGDIKVWLLVVKDLYLPCQLGAGS
ncbi:MAG: hypothetical protein E6165_07840, partial [Varibaculum cambriense]|nr:hypothetical protein [Varibaculum cambriense]